MNFLIMLSGLILLLASGEVIVRGAVSAAMRFGISTLVIGLTVVSLGTSAPELFVCLKAAIGGHDDISVGNVVGSNIANLGLVLGLTALIFPISVDRNSIVIDWPFMMGASLFFWWFLSDLSLTFWEGALSVLLLAGYIIFIVWRSRKDERLRKTIEQDEELEGRVSDPLPLSFLFLGVGIVGLTFWSDWFLKGAVKIAREDLGVSEHVIGLSLVAFGTSVPELATSGMAMFKKEANISVGNLMGSNMFNILAVLGITSLFKQITVNPLVLESDIFWMLAVSFVLLPLMWSGRKLHRVKGGALIVSYLAYLYFLIW